MFAQQQIEPPPPPPGRAPVLDVYRVHAAALESGQHQEAPLLGGVVVAAGAGVPAWGGARGCAGVHFGRVCCAACKASAHAPIHQLPAAPVALTRVVQLISGSSRQAVDDLGAVRCVVWCS